MICLPCRTVGRAIDIEKRGGRTFDREGAESLHRKCEWPASCACQHRVESATDKGQPK